MIKIGFAGLSHLGIVSSAAAADRGFEVVAFDSDLQLCEGLSGGELPIQEPGLEELLKQVSSRITYTGSPRDLVACDLVYLSLDVETDGSGCSDLGKLEVLIGQVMPCLKSGCTIVLLSQVPPGYTRRMRDERQLLLRSGDHPLFYQVETLIFGRAVERARYPERYIVGCQDPARLSPSLLEFLETFDCPVLPMRYESAELTKISINMFLAASISMSNSLAELCESIGADWSEITPALRLDRRIGEHAYLAPGLGIAGGNLERDLVSVLGMSQEHGADCGIVSSIIENSRYRRDWVLRQLHLSLGVVPSNAFVGIWGVAYKVDTKSTKNSPSLALISALSGSQMKAYDPAVDTSDIPTTVSRAASALDACEGADVLVVMTPWAEFCDVDLGQVRDVMKGTLIIDPFGLLEADRCAEHGLKHCRIGIPIEERV